MQTVSRGAKSIVDPKLFPAAREGTGYVAPTVLVDVTHDMKVMSDETL
jgi:acyl-CoA reductase-like NAD-dependent aldehyde dehydrogenase